MRGFHADVPYFWGLCCHWKTQNFLLKNDVFDSNSLTASPISYVHMVWGSPQGFEQICAFWDRFQSFISKIDIKIHCIYWRWYFWVSKAFLVEFWGDFWYTRSYSLQELQPKSTWFQYKKVQPCWDQYGQDTLLFKLISNRFIRELKDYEQKITQIHISKYVLSDFSVIIDLIGEWEGTNDSDFTVLVEQNWFGVEITDFRM